MRHILFLVEVPCSAAVFCDYVLLTMTFHLQALSESV